MKNKQKGFVGILVTIIIAIVAVGGGAYVYTSQNKVEVNGNKEENKNLVEKNDEQPLNNESKSNNIVSNKEVVETKINSSLSTKVILSVDDLKTMSLKEVWMIYLEPGKQSSEVISMAAKKISWMLGESAVVSKEVFTEIEKRILDVSEEKIIRDGLPRILGESDSPEALEILSKVIFTFNDNSELTRNTFEQLGRMGSPVTEDQATRMAEVAKKSWLESINYTNSKVPLQYVFGGILAKVADPGGLGILFLRSEAMKGGKTIAEVSASKNLPASIALDLSNKVKGFESEAVSVLAKSLEINDPTSTEFVWSGQALSSIGFNQGGSALIEWSKNAPDSCADLAKTWIGNLKDSRSQALVRELNSTGKSIKFNSEKVKNAVLEEATKIEM